CKPGACNAGWGDCNQDPSDGCEANLHTDAGNCGLCGTKCSFPHAAAACSDSCYIRSCNFGYDDCNANPADGCELPVLADRNNCGGCNVKCPNAANASNGCVNGGCQILGCSKGFADCDGSPGNGCEANTTTDVKNCGACGNVCGQGLVCVNSG